MRRYSKTSDGHIQHSDTPPEVMLIEAMFGGGGGSEMIERQEAEGQQQLQRVTMLPKAGTIRDLYDADKDLRGPWLALGVQFHEEVDDLFVRVTLPEGWAIRPTDHSMWSKLYDKQGRERGGIFYKAAFYDRSAHCFLKPRYSYRVLPVGGYEATDGLPPEEQKAYPRQAVVYDGESVVFATEGLPWFKDGRPYADEILQPQAVAWLTEHYADWKNPVAYW